MMICWTPSTCAFSNESRLGAWISTLCSSRRMPRSHQLNGAKGQRQISIVVTHYQRLLDYIVPDSTLQYTCCRWPPSSKSGTKSGAELESQQATAGWISEVA